MTVRQTIPLPRILHYSSTTHNQYSFPYIMMDFITGSDLGEVWRELTMESKEVIVRQLASHQAEMFDLKFDFIGNLYLQPSAGHPRSSNRNHKHNHYPNPDHNRDGKGIGIDF